MKILSGEDVSRIDYWLDRERAERRLAARARSADMRDAHIMMAERCADRAWSLGEEEGRPFVPSSLWAGAGNDHIAA